MPGQKSNIEWRKAGFEMFAIVFAVLLALWLEGWREDIELQHRAGEHLERIRAEIIQNSSGLDEAISEHESYIEGLDAALDANDVSIVAVADFLQIEGSAIGDAAWQSAQMSQSISQMPLEVIGELASIYDTQAYYTDYLNFFFQGYIDLVSDIQAVEQNRVAVQKFRHHLSITNSLAEQLQRRYRRFLAGRSDASEAEDAPAS